MSVWKWPSVQILWTVYRPPWSRSGRGSRTVIVRTAKALAHLSVNERGEVWNVCRKPRPSDYWTIWEHDLPEAMRPQYLEKPRWTQLPLALEFPPEPPRVIQLNFVFPDEFRIRLAA